ncbi:hypothetical protein G6M89_10505 [Natronolimnobius sp. AArcel1]|uniref:hypothetical protein n=1 Tax=Natronolimnobius sp. AArcel1 TaxID=1679093 RepID=UPI0013EDFE87|nr:hypothetical protein [Natronolimnobius sp. AArcel1]NGM69433.1 hypothetical protein [Natronolimnobius sp. AArcel1]
MTVAENRERGHYVESAACDRWPLERDDLTHEQRQEIAETLSTRVTNVEVEQTVTVDRE